MCKACCDSAKLRQQGARSRANTATGRLWLVFTKKPIHIEQRLVRLAIKAERGTSRGCKIDRGRGERDHVALSHQGADEELALPISVWLVVGAARSHPARLRFCSRVPSDVEWTEILQFICRYFRAVLPKVRKDRFRKIRANSSWNMLTAVRGAIKASSIRVRVDGRNVSARIKADRNATGADPKSSSDVSISGPAVVVVASDVSEYLSRDEVTSHG